MSFHKAQPEAFFGDSTLRLPDAVGVIEAQSNPSNGHYVGHWDTVRPCTFSSTLVTQAGCLSSWYRACGISEAHIFLRLHVSAQTKKGTCSLEPCCICNRPQEPFALRDALPTTRRHKRLSDPPTRKSQTALACSFSWEAVITSLYKQDARVRKVDTAASAPSKYQMLLTTCPRSN